MTLDQYNETVKKIFAEQQAIAQSAAKLATSGTANPTSPEFAQLMTRQWTVMQQMGKLNADMMMGIMSSKK